MSYVIAIMFITLSLAVYLLSFFSSYKSIYLDENVLINLGIIAVLSVFISGISGLVSLKKYYESLDEKKT